MNQESFWGHLEFRVCREMNGIEDCRKLGLWCDGFAPWAFDLNSPSRIITGRVWIGCGPGATGGGWEFRLLLDGQPCNEAEIDWAKQLPADNVTRWLTVDFDAMTLEIEPNAAIPDPIAD